MSTPQSHFTEGPLVDGAYYVDDRSIILQGDVLAELQRMIDSGIKVDSIVTSPPYYGQRDYGVDGQLGLEEHPQQVLDRLAEVSTLCREVLKDTGSLWINIGDAYWSGKGAHKSGEVKQGAKLGSRRSSKRAPQLSSETTCPDAGLWPSPGAPRFERATSPSGIWAWMGVSRKPPTAAIDTVGIT